MKVEVKSCRVLIFEYHERSKGRPLYSRPVLRIFSEFADFNVSQCVVEMIYFPQSVVSLGETMYQSAFFSLKFRTNTG